MDAHLEDFPSISMSIPSDINCFLYSDYSSRINQIRWNKELAMRLANEINSSWLIVIIRSVFRIFHTKKVDLNEVIRSRSIGWLKMENSFKFKAIVKMETARRKTWTSTSRHIHWEWKVKKSRRFDLVDYLRFLWFFPRFENWNLFDKKNLLLGGFDGRF